MAMESTLAQKPSPFNEPNLFKGYVLSYLLPFSIGGLAMAIAIFGAVLTRNSEGIGGVNGFVEGLSGNSSTFLGDLGILAPLGFAFIAGVVSTVNPCGFAMLPAYLGLYLGSNDSTASTNPVNRMGQALMVGLVVTSGFVVLFGITGIVIGAGARTVVDFIPWIGLSIGIILAIVGSWILGGGKLYTGLAGRAASHIGNPGQVSIKGYFLFGLSYGTASLSCTLPIFLTVVGVSFAASEILTSIGQFVLYALGMGLVIILMTLSMALFKEATVGFLRRTVRFVQPMSAGLMIVAGSYIIFYWLTIGGLL
jgi:cytochrome c biogenesis protein CcdA